MCIFFSSPTLMLLLVADRPLGEFTVRVCFPHRISGWHMWHAPESQSFHQQVEHCIDSLYLRGKLQVVLLKKKLVDCMSDHEKLSVLYYHPKQFLYTTNSFIMEERDWSFLFGRKGAPQGVSSLSVLCIPWATLQNWKSHGIETFTVASEEVTHLQHYTPVMSCTCFSGLWMGGTCHLSRTTSTFVVAP